MTAGDGGGAGAQRPAGHNRLARESSPYLLQHADNPVDWYPWGEEAFARAREADRPLLLSIGYSSCHWCHVMAHESFEDESIADLMNERFVNVKVDREERPDVDAVYMTATQALTGHGGWPMTVFITPDGKPFFAGTYFPPDDRGGLPGFRRLLTSISEAWQNNRPRLLESADEITRRLAEATEHSAAGSGLVTAEQADEAVHHFRGQFDPVRGGFGGAPKFPAPGNLEFLLMHHARAGEAGREPSALHMVLTTLRAMSRGGIYDHLGGGFHRYSVDAGWVVPHFEKMLYDNAQLARTYLHAWQITGERDFERVVRETLDYLLREMRDEAGGFHAAQDADTEGIEGKYFVWTPAEIQHALTYCGEDDFELFMAVFDVTEQGNFEDPHHPEFGRRNVLRMRSSVEEGTAGWDRPIQELEARLKWIRERLREEREATRVRPGQDDKVLTSWNGLALAAFAEAGRVLGETRYVEVASRNAAFVRETMWRDGRLLHTYRDGVAKVDGLLEDYAYYGLGLLELYRATGDLAHLRWAEELFEALLERFHDDEAGGFFDTPSDGEALVLRQKPLFDAASPSGNGAAALLGLWLGRTLERPQWEEYLREVVALTQDHLVRAANGFGSVWQAIELMLAPRREVAIAGAAVARAPFEREAARRFLPAVVLAPGAEEGLPLLDGRIPAAGAVAYVCEDMVCDLPATTPEGFAEQLDALAAGAR